MVLSTHSCLLAARRLYARTGYALTDSRPHEGFGSPLVTETWERAL